MAIAVAGYFILNPLHAATYDPERIWFVLDILMVLGAAIALVFNAQRKLEEDAAFSDQPRPREYWESNIAFYATVAVTILLLHSWISNLALGLNTWPQIVYS